MDNMTGLAKLNREMVAYAILNKTKRALAEGGLTHLTILMLKKLLSHNYHWIAKKAAEKVGHLARRKDIDELN